MVGNDSRGTSLEQDQTPVRARAVQRLRWRLWRRRHSGQPSTDLVGVRRLPLPPSLFRQRQNLHSEILYDCFNFCARRRHRSST